MYVDFVPVLENFIANSTTNVNSGSWSFTYTFDESTKILTITHSGSTTYYKFTTESTSGSHDILHIYAIRK